MAGLVTAYPRSEAYAVFSLVGRSVLRAPVVPHSRVVRIDGKERVRSVVVEDLSSGRRRTIECDTVVTTGDWIPDHELVRLAGIELDRATRGPMVDAGLATDRPGVFAVGNLIHPVDTADGAALDGRHVAAAVRTWLAHQSPDHPTPDAASGFACGALGLEAAHPFRWVTPQRVPAGGGSPRGQLLLRTDEYRRFPVVVATQDGAEVGRVRTPWPAAPGRVSGFRRGCCWGRR